MGAKPTTTTGDKRRDVNKFNIQFIGQKQYIARDLDEARKAAMDDLKYVHPSIGLSINGHMDLGPIGEEE